MSQDGINGRSIQTLRGENDSKQSDEFQAMLSQENIYRITSSNFELFIEIKLYEHFRISKQIYFTDKVYR